MTDPAKRSSRAAAETASREQAATAGGTAAPAGPGKGAVKPSTTHAKARDVFMRAHGTPNVTPMSQALAPVNA